VNKPSFISPPPPQYDAAHYLSALQSQGFAPLAAATVQDLAAAAAADLQQLYRTWDDLPADQHLRDGGKYRQRRHASFVIAAQAGFTPENAENTVKIVPHRAHWQSTDYNALHGGIERWFEPMDAAALANPAWPRLLAWLGQVASSLKGGQDWYAEAHQFRILTHTGIGGIGRPTPEGAHRDGVDLVAVFLLGRHGIKGGETRVFDARGSHGERFTLSEPWSVLLLDDQRVIHESTPIQPADGCDAGWRDTLVVTLRAGGFQASGA
jgi:hypothetical protein